MRHCVEYLAGGGQVAAFGVGVEDRSGDDDVVMESVDDCGSVDGFDEPEIIADGGGAGGGGEGDGEG